MAAAEIKTRPNIRVEIKNNLAEEMDVDEDELKSEEEEGEIPNDKEIITFAAPQKVNPTFKGTFTTGINIFDKEEQEKLQERARRFQLKPEEITNFTDEDLHLLYSSLGLNAENETAVRFEAIHLRGIEQMTAEDVLEYFLKYAPNEIEWVDDESCNVVWLDKITAARALHFISKPIKGMPIRKPDPLEAVEVQDNTSILLRNRQVEIQEEEEKIDFEGAVDVDTISAKIPPGYWRLGNPHPKAKNLLLRFSLKTDKRPYKSELFSRYYKNFSKIAGVEKKIKSRGIFDRNKDLSNKSDKNPWGMLAKNWDEDSQFRERERIIKDDETKVEIKNPSILVRLGSKRKPDDMEEDENNEEDNEEKSKKKMKIPRMRMYADEEEEKIKRKKLLKTITKQIEKIDETPSNSVDLRDMLGTTNRRLKDDAKKDTFDLGATLKNRNKKMIFAVKSEMESDKPQRREDIRSRLDKRRSPIRHRQSPVRRFHRSRRRSEELSEDDEYDTQKTKSKVAVVIKTSKRPTVASSVNSVWSRVDRKRVSSSESSSSGSSENSSSSSNSEDSDSNDERKLSRPGFRSAMSKRGLHTKSPLKLEVSNYRK